MAVIDLVTGFLGAGKTTFIRGYAEWLSRTGQSFCVIENEYGAAGVDSAYLKNSNIDVEELSGGCICCSLKVGFHDAILRLSEFCGRIIVEPSGIFSPDDFFDVVNSPNVSRLNQMGCAVTVCDVRMTRLDGGALDVFRQELNAAGIILVSKTQTASAAEISDCVAFLREIRQNGAEAPILTADWQTFTDRDYEMISGAKPVCHEHSRITQDHSALFSGTTLHPEREYSDAEISSVLRGLREQCSGNILRIKGYLNASPDGSFHINCTAGNAEFVRMEQRVPPMLNIIGQGLDRKQIKKCLDM
jgi:G3E family GTPase